MNARDVIKQNFGRWLWFQRSKQGMTQRDLEKKSGVSKSAIGYAENGGLPHPEIRKKIFIALGYKNPSDGMDAVMSFAREWRGAA